MSAPLILTEFNPEDWRELRLASHADGHTALPPSLIWRRDGELVGYASVGRVAFIGGWACSQRVKDAEAKTMFQAAIEHARRSGAKLAAVAVTDDCRFRPFLPDLNFKPNSRPTTLSFKLL